MPTPRYDGGPGPWVLLFPLVWAFAAIGVILLLRRTLWRGRSGPWQYRAAHGGHSPVAVLGRRYAEGAIDETEYRCRLSVLTEAEHREDPDLTKRRGGGA